MSRATELTAVLERLLMKGDSTISKVNPDDVVVGTIYCAVDHYSDRLNRSYYQVVKRSPKSVTLAHMSNAGDSDYSYGSYDNSVPGRVSQNGKTFVARLQPDGAVKINRYITAWVYSIPSGQEA